MFDIYRPGYMHLRLVGFSTKTKLAEGQIFTAIWKKPKTNQKATEYRQETGTILKIIENYIDDSIV